MSWSLNEVEVLSKKAARGAGYSWGMAEEAGRAVRWLSRQGQDGAAALAELLEGLAGADPVTLAPTELRADMSERKGLCPLALGTLISDMPGLPGAGLVAGGVRAPLLVLPFAATAARRLGQAISVEAGPSGAVTDGDALFGLRPFGGAGLVSIGPSAIDGPRSEQRHRVLTGQEVWARLDVFAQRTYAPATEASRLKGAGDGSVQDD